LERVTNSSQTLRLGAPLTLHIIHETKSDGESYFKFDANLTPPTHMNNIKAGGIMIFGCFSTTDARLAVKLVKPEPRVL
jgi:hypothetical protein